jgi:hypothetical protein
MFPPLSYEYLIHFYRVCHFPDPLYVRANELSRKQQSNMVAEAKASDLISADVTLTVGVESSVGSVVSGLVDNDMLYGGQAMAFVSKAVALQGLGRLAARKTLLNTPDDRESGAVVVVSPLILKMLHTCEITAKGNVWVVCAPPDQGKRAASEFIMHGEHSLRPDRSLKIDATDWKDFRADCAEGVLCCPQLASTLRTSRAPADVDDSDPSFLWKVSNWIGRLSCLALDSKVKFDEQRPITIYGPMSKEVPVDGATRKSSPILIIDDFDEVTEANKGFVKELLRDAAKLGVVVFILTRDQDWATTLVQLNCGSKIKPLIGNVDIRDYDGTNVFDEVPMWNAMDWSVTQLREDNSIRKVLSPMV